MRVIFAGTPDFSCPTLEALLASTHEVVAVLTQPDKTKGRGRKLANSPVKALANSHAIEVFQPNNLKPDEVVQTIADYQADVMVVVAYGLILPKRVIDLFSFGAINVHASLLPKYRGASPIQASLLAGDKQTGVTIMQMDEGLDTGDMLQMLTCDIADNETSQSLHDKLSHLGGAALCDTLDGLKAGTVTPISQDDDKASYAGKIKKEDGLIDWQHSASQLMNQFRAYYGWPGSFSFAETKRFRIHQMDTVSALSSKEKPGTIIAVDKTHIDVATGEGVLRLTELQLDNGKRLAVKDLLNGKHPFLEGQQLGERCQDATH